MNTRSWVWSVAAAAVAGGLYGLALESGVFLIMGGAAIGSVGVALLA